MSAFLLFADSLFSLLFIYFIWPFSSFDLHFFYFNFPVFIFRFFFLYSSSLSCLLFSFTPLLMIFSPLLILSISSFLCVPLFSSHHLLFLSRYHSLFFFAPLLLYLPLFVYCYHLFCLPPRLVAPPPSPLSLFPLRLSLSLPSVSSLSPLRPHLSRFSPLPLSSHICCACLYFQTKFHISMYYSIL